METSMVRLRMMPEILMTLFITNRPLWLFGYQPQGMDNGRDVKQETQHDIDNQILAGPFLEKDS
jgi:hypothetical protein